MRTLLLALLLFTCAPAHAEPPQVPPTWRPMIPVVTCTVDTEAEPGFCRLFHDQETDEVFLVFWDKPHDIKWIRSGTNGDYTYLYERKTGVAL